MILAKHSEWSDLRARIRGICNTIDRGEADDEEQEHLTIEKVGERNPEKLKPLPAEQGLAVTLKYEQGAQDRKKGPARGDKSADKSAAEPEGDQPTPRLYKYLSLIHI